MFLSRALIAATARAQTIAPTEADYNTLLLNGSSQYAQASSSATLQLPTDMQFTFAFWVYPTVTGSEETIISKYDDSGTAHEYTIRRDSSDKLFVFVLNGSSSALINGTSTSTLPQNTKTHVMVKSDGSNCYIYLDNVLDNTLSVTAGTPKQSTSVFRIGARSTPTPALYFTGSIGPVYKMDGALSDTLRNEWYNSGTLKQPWDYSTDLKNTYDFACPLNTGADSSNRLLDYSGNTNDLTATGSPTFTGETITMVISSDPSP